MTPRRRPRPALRRRSRRRGPRSLTGSPSGATVRRAALERIAKPAVMVALIAAAAHRDAGRSRRRSAVRPWLVAALVASLVGDVLLLPPGRFVPGLLAFLVAHLAYVVAFVQLPGQRRSWLVAGIGRRRGPGGDRRARSGPRRATRRGSQARSRRTSPRSAPWPSRRPGQVSRPRSSARGCSWRPTRMLGWGRFSAPRRACRGAGRAPRVAVRATYHLPAQARWLMSPGWAPAGRRRGLLAQGRGGRSRGRA